MDGVGIKNALDCPELNYAPEQLEEVAISNAEFEQLLEAEAELAKTYADKRKLEYPPMEDYLDGIVKGDQAQVDKYISDCLAVKEKYPKGDN